MKSIIYGLFFIALGIILFAGGMYTGVWIMLVGGVVNIIEQIKSTNVDSMIVAMSIVKILFCEFPVVLGVWFGLFFTGIGIKLALSYQDYYR